MPTYDFASESKSTGQELGSSLYDVLYSTFAKSTDNTSFSNSIKAVVGLKTRESYHGTMANIPSGIYQVSAGCGLDSIFYPFETSSNGISVYGLPTFASGISLNQSAAAGGQPNFYDLLPLTFNPTKTSVVFDRIVASDIDGLSDLISGERYFGQVNQFRDVSKTRSIGLRLPLVGVGWGYDLDGRAYPPHPGDSTKFRGNTTDGKKVDPSHYIAAPIDFRYDSDRHVWTCGITSIPMLKIIDAPVGFGGGKYLCKIWIPPEDPLSYSGTLSESELGSEGDYCIAFNTAEVGELSNDLDNDSDHSKIFPAVFLGYGSVPPGVNGIVGGMPYYLINGLNWYWCGFNPG